jgi:hypothetical protein
MAKRTRLTRKNLGKPQTAQCFVLPRTPRTMALAKLLNAIQQNPHPKAA